MVMVSSQVKRMHYYRFCHYLLSRELIVCMQEAIHWYILNTQLGRELHILEHVDTLRNGFDTMVNLE